MITNVHRAKASGDIQRYIRYTIAPEKDQKNPNYKHGERTLAIESDYVSIGSDVQRNRTSNHITDQFIAWNEEKRAGNTKPKSPAVLGVISFSASDTEKFYSTTDNGTRYLDHQKIIAVAREAVSETMGGDRPMYFALHGDKEHLHVHFAASMVNSQGKIYDGSKMVNEEGKTVSIRDFRKWEMTNETLEQKYDLEKVSHRKAFEHQGEHRQSQVARPSNAVVNLAKKGEIAPSLDLAGRLDFAYTNCNKQFDQFLELAEHAGIRIKPNMNATKVNGLAFACDDMDGFIKASDLGNRYKWTKLEKELHYDNSRDYQKLAGLKATADIKRPDIRTTGTNQRVASINDNIVKATETTVGLITSSEIESGHTTGSNTPSPSNWGTQTRTDIEQDQHGRSSSIIETIKQDSWDDGRGLQLNDETGRESRGSREDSTRNEFRGLVNEHISNSSSNVREHVLLQRQAGSPGNSINQANCDVRPTTTSESHSIRVGKNLSSAKATIDALFNGDDPDAQQVEEHLTEGEYARIAREFKESIEQQEQQRKQNQYNRAAYSTGLER